MNEWLTDYRLGPDQRANFGRDGYVKIPGYFSDESLSVLRDAVLTAVERIGSSVDGENRDQEYPSDDIELYRQAFTQVYNIWLHDAVVREFVFGRLARTAAELMNVSAVRIYHDQALIKEPGGVATPWHLDHYYWPLATDKVLTAWVPLNQVDLNMGPLEFAPGSHELDYARDFELIQQDEDVTRTRLEEFGVDTTVSPYQLGEVSFHNGWVFHRANGNSSTSRRNVFTVIFMDEATTLQASANPNQEYDRERWCPGVAVGQLIDSPLNPVCGLE